MTKSILDKVLPREERIELFEQMTPLHLVGDEVLDSDGSHFFDGDPNRNQFTFLTLRGFIHYIKSSEREQVEAEIQPLKDKIKSLRENFLRLTELTDTLIRQ